MTTVITRGIGPDEILDIGLDWTNRLSSGATVASAVWSQTQGDAVQAMMAQTISGNQTRIRLSGGTLLMFYEWLCIVTSSTGEVHENTLQISCVQK